MVMPLEEEEALTPWKPERAGNWGSTRSFRWLAAYPGTGKAQRWPVPGTSGSV